MYVLNDSLANGLSNKYISVCAFNNPTVKAYSRTAFSNSDKTTGTLLYFLIWDSEHCQSAIIDTWDFRNRAIIRDTSKYGYRILTKSDGAYISLYYDNTRDEVILYTSYAVEFVGLWMLHMGI